MISTSHWIPFNYGTPSTLDEWIEKGWSNQPFNDEAIAAAEAAYPIIVLDEPKKNKKAMVNDEILLNSSILAPDHDCLQFAKRILTNGNGIILFLLYWIIPPSSLCFLFKFFKKV